MDKKVRSNNTFLLIFFGAVILIQLIGIALRGFKANTGQLFGITVGLLGYLFILNSYMKEKNNRNK